MVNSSIESRQVVGLLSAIQQTSSVEDAISIIKQIDALKVALEAVDQFREQSITYAKLEAEALIRCVELGGLNELRRDRKKCAAWLSGLSYEERSKYISMCADGMTIDNIWKREIGDGAKFKEIIDDLETRRDWLIDDVKEKGIVSIREFSELVRSKLPNNKKALADDIVDGLRSRLRQSGAVGVGDDDNTYVMPTPENDAEVKKAILLRYKSICADFERIAEIKRAAEITFSYKEFDDGSNWSYESNLYVTHILIALCATGVICDDKALAEAIAKSDARKEMDYAKRLLSWGHDEYIRREYEAMLKAKGDKD